MARFRAFQEAAIRKEKYWFIVMLVVNSIGIVPILYLYVFQDTARRKKIASFVKSIFGPASKIFK